MATGLRGLNDETLVSEVQIASLWSGYGTITRQHHRLVDPDIGLPVDSTAILKRVRVPTLTASDLDDVSHVRKLRSYRVERYFYTHLADKCRSLGAHVPMTCPRDTAEDGRGDDAIFMEDLQHQYPGQVEMDTRGARSVLDWLALFHASFWPEGDDDDDDDDDGRCTIPTIETTPPCADEPDVLARLEQEFGVWSEGSYWPLATRREEFEHLPSTEWEDLAVSIDADLRAIPRHFLTLIHGDCKAANVACDATRTRSALYDFQYVGRGPGTRDLVYFFVSSVRQIDRQETVLLDHYHTKLSGALCRRGLTHQASLYTRDVMMAHYEICMLDYYRFMLGWGLWGNSAWAKRRVDEIVTRREANSRNSK